VRVRRTSAGRCRLGTKLGHACWPSWPPGRMSGSGKRSSRRCRSPRRKQRDVICFKPARGAEEHLVPPPELRIRLVHLRITPAASARWPTPSGALAAGPCRRGRVASCSGSHSPTATDFIEPHAFAQPESVETGGEHGTQLVVGRDLGQRLRRAHGEATQRVGAECLGLDAPAEERLERAVGLVLAARRQSPRLEVGKEAAHRQSSGLAGGGCKLIQPPARYAFSVVDVKPATCFVSTNGCMASRSG